ncbi:MAG TPA: enolase C-terminal domain-like protein [Dinghuibacter sp.]|uniref:enolase C-terminal domain-like protein n=1 Tax=Dinghuibacter sp. TaxID=2024697 RepID=UPI002C9C1BC1|nr:enolase C-terminal domain-like protein [Dinghuibacter sp.]HTJ12397.1 enolase C-terminal domain-like protein [Dinghuibacter sp.]
MNNPTNRRDLIKFLGSAGLLGLAGPAALAGPRGSAPRPTGLPPLKIKNVKAIATAPEGANLVLVKVETSEPGLYGIGCATFTQRAEVVVAAINNYLPDFCIGKDVDNIEDMWQSAFVSSYWRNGPVLNNALSGLDQALWDIKGKRANMPVYQLLGGKSRFAVSAYAHADGKSPEEVADNVQKYMSQGFRYIRIQQGGYGSLYLAQQPDFKNEGFGRDTDDFMDPIAYVQAVPKLFKTVRERCGESIDLLHDTHERVQPQDMINMCKRIEEFNPYWIEDPVSPENMDWFPQLRAATTVPFAMGELFNNTNEFIPYMVKRSFDYIRCHVSQVGGITPALKIARLGEFFNIKSGWHGPGDVSPVGHAAHCHIDLAIWNFGVQESVFFSDKCKEVFPGTPEIKNGYLYVNEAPGLGVDVNETLAAKYPINNHAGHWTIRRRDGTIIRP